VTILLIFAFLAGVLTILAPCTLPMVPLILGTAAGGGRARPWGIVAGLALSFTLFSVVLAAALTALGLTTDKLRLIAVGALALFGLILLLPAGGRWLERGLAPLARLGRRGPGAGPGRGGFAGGLALGGALGLIWAPCSGPIMATVLVLAATRGASLDAVGIALAYAGGAGLPLLAISYGGRALVQRTGRLARGGVQRAFGGLLLLSCVAILFNLDLRIQDVVAGALPPDWTNNLYSVEQQAPVQQALQSLRDPAPPNLAPAASGPAARPPLKELPPLHQPIPAPTPPPTRGPANPALAALPPPVAANLPASVPLEDLGPAPELTGITDWINSPPLTIQQLRGKVVLVHFWTFACINCIHVQPYVKSWYMRYQDSGFVVLGIHTPELSFEKEIGNVRDAVGNAGVTFPVAFDPQYATWNAYHNGYWPAFYFVDKQGRIRHTHVGEGDYEGSEQVIRQLLSAPGATGN